MSTFWTNWEDGFSIYSWESASILGVKCPWTLSTKVFSNYSPVKSLFCSSQSFFFKLNREHQKGTEFRFFRTERRDHQMVPIATKLRLDRLERQSLPDERNSHALIKDFTASWSLASLSYKAHRLGWELAKVYFPPFVIEFTLLCPKLQSSSVDSYRREGIFSFGEWKNLSLQRWRIQHLWCRSEWINYQRAPGECQRGLNWSVRSTRKGSKHSRRTMSKSEGP